ncbi:MAG: hypothetical protein ACI4WY_08725 [Anaerovoracaceae bacterium]
MKKEKSMSDIITYTGIQMNPLRPKPEQIEIRDIAHALSLICRGGGHVKHFYSVAQHCLACAEEARMRGYSVRVQLGSLLHDSSEAYIADVTRPVKQQMPQYYEIEGPLQAVIWEKFMTDADGRPMPPDEEEKKQIFTIDDQMMSLDLYWLLGDRTVTVSPDILSDRSEASRDFVPMKQVEQAFLQRFTELKRQLDAEMQKEIVL